MKTDLAAWIADRHPRLALLAHPTGDEDRMLRERYPGRVFVHRDFLAAWEEARGRGFPAAVCDGGLQDPALGECPAVRIEHPGMPRTAADLLPFGRYRALVARPRAEEIVLELGTDLRRELDPGSLPPPSTSVRAACSVARPEAFAESLRDAGLEVAELRAFGDHARFPASLLERMRRDPGAWVVTAKDASRQDLPTGVHVARGRIVLSDAARAGVEGLMTRMDAGD